MPITTYANIIRCDSATEALIIQAGADAIDIEAGSFDFDSFYTDLSSILLALEFTKLETSGSGPVQIVANLSNGTPAFVE